MTQSDKNKIMLLKKRGMTYNEISAVTGINANSIASFLRRSKMPKTETTEGICKFCAKEISGRGRIFCSSVCKNAWWNLHRNEKSGSASHTSVCLACGKEMSVYGNPNKKFCSHDCYIRHRFGKAEK